MSRLSEGEVPEIVRVWAEKAGIQVPEALRRYQKAAEIVREQYPKVEPESDQWYRLKVGVFKGMMGFKPVPVKAAPPPTGGTAPKDRPDSRDDATKGKPEKKPDDKNKGRVRVSVSVDGQKAESRADDVWAHYAAPRKDPYRPTGFKTFDAYVSSRPRVWALAGVNYADGSLDAVRERLATQYAREVVTVRTSGKPPQSVKNPKDVGEVVGRSKPQTESEQMDGTLFKVLDLLSQTEGFVEAPQIHGALGLPRLAQSMAVLTQMATEGLLRYEKGRGYALPVDEPVESLLARAGPVAVSLSDRLSLLGPVEEAGLPQGVTTKKLSVRGWEQMWLVKKFGVVLGYVTKVKNTRTDTHPYKAFRYNKAQGVTVGGAHQPVDAEDSTYLGAAYGDGMKAAATAVANNTKLSESVEEESTATIHTGDGTWHVSGDEDEVEIRGPSREDRYRATLDSRGKIRLVDRTKEKVEVDELPQRVAAAVLDMLNDTDEAVTEAGAYSIQYRVPGKGWKEKSFPNQAAAEVWVEKLIQREGDDVEVRWQRTESVEEAKSDADFSQYETWAKTAFEKAQKMYAAYDEKADSAAYLKLETQVARMKADKDWIRRRLAQEADILASFRDSTTWSKAWEIIQSNASGKVNLRISPGARRLLRGESVEEGIDPLRRAVKRFGATLIGSHSSLSQGYVAYLTGDEEAREKAAAYLKKRGWEIRAKGDKSTDVFKRDDADEAVTESKKAPPIDSPVYTEKVKWPKHNVKIGPLGSSHDAAGKILATRLPGWTKDDHRAAAAQFEKEAAELEKEWSRLADEAAQKTWGRPYKMTDYRISGIASDEFSDEHKDLLRKAALGATLRKDAAFAHRAASKLRRLARESVDESSSGEFSDRDVAQVRATMPKTGLKSKKYVFASRKAKRTFARGETLTYKGEKWRVYDADAEGGDLTLYLVSPDFKRWLRDVPPEAFSESIEEGSALRDKYVKLSRLSLTALQGIARRLSLERMSNHADQLSVVMADQFGDDWEQELQDEARDESLLPSTLDAYEQVIAEGGLSSGALSVLLGDDPLDEGEVEDANGVVWAPHGDRWLPDVAEAKKAKGYWRTTKSGKKVYIENGKVTKGNPHVLKAASGKGGETQPSAPKSKITAKAAASAVRKAADDYYTRLEKSWGADDSVKAAFKKDRDRLDTLAYILDHGHLEAARGYWRDLDTAVRDVVPDSVLDAMGVGESVDEADLSSEVDESINEGKLETALTNAILDPGSPLGPGFEQYAADVPRVRRMVEAGMKVAPPAAEFYTSSVDLGAAMGHGYPLRTTEFSGSNADAKKIARAMLRAGGIREAIDEALPGSAKVPVYAKDRKTKLAEVSANATSIGAAKAAKAKACAQARIDGKLAWVVKESVEDGIGSNQWDVEIKVGTPVQLTSELLDGWGADSTGYVTAIRTEQRDGKSVELYCVHDMQGGRSWWERMDLVPRLHPEGFVDDRLPPGYLDHQEPDPLYGEFNESVLVDLYASRPNTPFTEADLQTAYAEWKQPAYAVTFEEWIGRHFEKVEEGYALTTPYDVKEVDVMTVLRALSKPEALIERAVEPEIEATEVLRISTSPKDTSSGPGPTPLSDWQNYVVYDDGTVVRESWRDGRNVRAVVGNLGAEGIVGFRDNLRSLVVDYSGSLDGRVANVTATLSEAQDGTYKGRALCGECGEYWPCSDSKRKDISGLERAKHHVYRPRPGDKGNQGKDESTGDARFDAWMKKVDAAIVRRAGVSSADLPDVNYRDWFDDGVSPERAAVKAVRAAKDESVEEGYQHVHWKGAKSLRFKIATGSGGKTVQGRTFGGDIGIHANSKLQHWVVTHIPTGLRIGTTERDEDAVKVAKSLEGNSAIDLSFTDMAAATSETMAAIKAAAARLRESVEEALTYSAPIKRVEKALRAHNLNALADDLVRASRDGARSDARSIAAQIKEVAQRIGGMTKLMKARDVLLQELEDTLIDSTDERVDEVTDRDLHKALGLMNALISETSNKADRERYEEIADFLSRGKVALARQAANRLDSAPRDRMPDFVWFNVLGFDESVDEDQLDEFDPVTAIAAVGAIAVGAGLSAAAIKAIRVIKQALQVGKKTAAEKAWDTLSQNDQRAIQAILRGGKGVAEERTYQGFQKATEYISKIRNKGKKEYARAYLDYLMGKTSEDPERSKFGISYMAAQSVRLELQEFGFEESIEEITTSATTGGFRAGGFGQSPVGRRKKRKRLDLVARDFDDDVGDHEYRESIEDEDFEESHDSNDEEEDDTAFARGGPGGGPPLNGPKLKRKDRPVNRGQDGSIRDVQGSNRVESVLIPKEDLQRFAVLARDLGLPASTELVPVTDGYDVRLTAAHAHAVREGLGLLAMK